MSEWDVNRKMQLVCKYTHHYVTIEGHKCGINRCPLSVHYISYSHSTGMFPSLLCCHLTLNADIHCRVHIVNQITVYCVQLLFSKTKLSFYTTVSYITVVVNAVYLPPLPAHLYTDAITHLSRSNT